VCTLFVIALICIVILVGRMGTRHCPRRVATVRNRSDNSDVEMGEVGTGDNVEVMSENEEFVGHEVQGQQELDGGCEEVEEVEELEGAVGGGERFSTPMKGQDPALLGLKLPDSSSEVDFPKYRGMVAVDEGGENPLNVSANSRTGMIDGGEKPSDRFETPRRPGGTLVSKLKKSLFKQ